MLPACPARLMTRFLFPRRVRRVEISTRISRQVKLFTIMCRKFSSIRRVPLLNETLTSNDVLYTTVEDDRSQYQKQSETFTDHIFLW